MQVLSLNLNEIKINPFHHFEIVANYTYSVLLIYSLQRNILFRHFENIESYIINILKHYECCVISLYTTKSKKIFQNITESQFNYIFMFSCG